MAAAAWCMDEEELLTIGAGAGGAGGAADGFEPEDGPGVERDS